jgi:putative ABC transport system permease protein
MLRHNFLLAIRSFKRFKSTFFINLIGLSTGLACTMLIYLWVNDELNKNQFHTKSDRLYQVMENQQYADKLMTTYSNPGILAETLKEEVPEVEYAAATTWIQEFTLSIENNNVKAEGYYVGADYFNIFTFPLIHGDADQVLQDKNSIVISEELAMSLFNTSEDVIGKQVEFQHKTTFLVSGVFKKLPSNSSIELDFVLSFEKFKEDNDWVNEWGNNGPRSFVVLNEGADGQAVSDKIVDFIKLKYEDSNVELFLKPYREIYLYGSYENGVQSGGRIEYVRLFSIIALFILIIACINFMNLSTARASRRSKEIGIKKAVGASKRSLIYQYLGESLFMSFLSLVLAVLVVIIILPEFNDITSKKIILTLDWSLILSFFGIALFSGLVAGSYPALYLSAMNTISILKGNLRSTAGELIARKGLVIFQFFISVLLIVSVIVVYQQIDFVQSKNLGYNKDNLIFFEVEGKVEGNRETFISEIKKINGVVGAAGTSHNLLGQYNNTSGLDWEGKNPEDRILFENVSVGYEMLELLDVEMKEGRTFMKDFSQDSFKIIFNEAAIAVMGMKDPIGKKITLWEKYDYEIVGVVKDFHFQSLHEKVEPLFFRLRPSYSWNIMIKIKAGQEKETLANLKNFYEDYNTGFTFDYRFLDEQYAKQYASEQRVSTLSKYFAGVTVLISCLGLFGLAAFTAERRTKEIGIRKALGSSALNIIYLLSSDFTKMVSVSILLALPLSYYLLQNWLEDFAYRIELEWWFFLGAGFTALFIAWFTVGSQAIKAAHINPAQCLRDE